MTARHEIIVVGAGVVGMATALTLAERGHRVTVIDGAAAPGLGTSFANGAQLSYAYTDALASPGTLAQIPRVLLGLDRALRFHLRLDPDLLAWGLAFLRNGSAARFRANTLAGLALAAQSRTALGGLATRHGLQFGHAMPGKIHLYRSAKSFAGARSMVALKQAHGVTQTLLGPDEAVALEPMLAPVRAAIVGALHTADEEVGDPHRFCLSAHDALLRAGGSSLLGTGIDRIIATGQRPSLVTSDGTRVSADRIVLAAGTGSVALARQLGVRLPVQPMKGYSITLPPGAAAPSASITDVANRVVFARIGNRMRIAGLAELGRRDTRVDPARLRVLIDSARAALPQAADYDQIETSWAGLRPMTPNSLPIIRTIAPGVIAATGHGALGWTYAAGSAERVADIIEERG
ncbi:D-amino-acid dehydrogenase [Sphingomonas sp. BE123]|jgi:D-amino-acid dehydrogenase|uniref:FAD-dependent oxidoreductase n=1 Tax=Sphingomonas sp. BE123 TaxID=2817842 RepID=UPI002858316B|nr:FAD-dependent oxidoreductase [Sphingomonas sp. BE123]MDR6853286.1 D-amino-acid dehydrogenase [Sphingomonas sp. BE123]